MDKQTKEQREQESWKNAWKDAEHERTIMVAEFHAWLVKTRIETEKRLLTTERHQKDIAPFAQAGMDNAPTPKDVPLCVMEFAVQTLQVMELQRKLDLLNVYYRQAANNENTQCLSVEEGNEAEVNELWDWFVSEQEK